MIPVPVREIFTFLRRNNHVKLTHTFDANSPLLSSQVANLFPVIVGKVGEYASWFNVRESYFKIVKMSREESGVVCTRSDQIAGACTFPAWDYLVSLRAGCSGGLTRLFFFSNCFIPSILSFVLISFCLPPFFFLSPSFLRPCPDS
jgi:hypothetical protein